MDEPDEDGVGSPPRVRSRLRPRCGVEGFLGITSACAEQTHVQVLSEHSSWDHLRVCGADVTVTCRSRSSAGSPPRVRSRLCVPLPQVCPGGITSACAEQTMSLLACSSLYRDHLRVCGADQMEQHHTVAKVGSPPRVRSRQRQTAVHYSLRRITSACAEQILMCEFGGMVGGDHLRVCGADWWNCTPDWCPAGSPPRVRSRPDTVDG